MTNERKRGLLARWMNARRRNRIEKLQIKLAQFKGRRVAIVELMNKLQSCPSSYGDDAIQVLGDIYATDKRIELLRARQAASQ